MVIEIRIVFFFDDSKMLIFFKNRIYKTLYKTVYIQCDYSWWKLQNSCIPTMLYTVAVMYISSVTGMKLIYENCIHSRVMFAVYRRGGEATTCLLLSLSHMHNLTQGRVLALWLILNKKPIWYVFVLNKTHLKFEFQNHILIPYYDKFSQKSQGNRKW